jgi:hypothetical protein
MQRTFRCGFDVICRVELFHRNQSFGVDSEKRDKKPEQSANLTSTITRFFQKRKKIDVITGDVRRLNLASTGCRMISPH